MAQSGAVHCAYCFSLLWLCNISQKRRLHSFQTALTLFCLSDTSHSLYQSNCALTRMCKECFEKSLNPPVDYNCLLPPMLSAFCLRLPSFQRTELIFFIKLIHETLLNVTGKHVSLQLHCNCVLL